MFEGRPEGLGAAAVVVLAEAASQELGAEEDEGGLDDVVQAVVSYLRVKAVGSHAFHLRAVDVHVALHAYYRVELCAAWHSARTVVGEHVGQVHVALIAEPVAIVSASAPASVIRGKLHTVLEHAIGKHRQIKPPPIEGDHRRMPLADEVSELLQDLRLIGWCVFLAAKGAKLQELVIGVEPQHAERDHLVKRRGRKSADCRVPSQIRIGNSFDVEDEKRSGHGLKLTEKHLKIPALRLA